MRTHEAFEMTEAGAEKVKSKDKGCDKIELPFSWFMMSLIFCVLQGLKKEAHL